LFELIYDRQIFGPIVSRHAHRDFPLILFATKCRVCSENPP